MAITIRQEQDAGSNATNISFTTTSVVGDTIILIQLNDWYTLSVLEPPSGTAVTTWNLRQTYDGGSNKLHCKVWEGTVTTANGTVLVNNNSDLAEERYAACFVLTSGTYDTGANSVGAASTSFVAPSATAAGSDDQMLCVWANTDQVSTPNLTPPVGMTAYTQRALGSFITYRAASEQLVASGASGTRTCTSSQSKPYLAITVLVKSTASVQTLNDKTGFATLGKPVDSLAISKVLTDQPTGALAVNTASSVNTNEKMLFAGATSGIRAAAIRGETIARGIALDDPAVSFVRLLNTATTKTSQLIWADRVGVMAARSTFGEVLVTSSPTSGFVCQDFSASVSVDRYTGVAQVEAYAGTVTVDSYGGVATNCGR